MFMQDNGDSSVWRSLAVAFGDGVAFGVGMKLARNAAARGGRLELAPPPPAPVFDRKVVEAVVSAVETRIEERAAQLERRIDELEARTEPIRAELAELRKQLETNERTMRDFLLAMGQVCRDASK